MKCKMSNIYQGDKIIAKQIEYYLNTIDIKKGETGYVIGAKRNQYFYLIKHIQPLIHNHVPTK